MSKRYFQITTIYNYDLPTERREVSYETARTARVMLRARGVHLHKEAKAKGNRRYATEYEGVWVIYWRRSSLPDEVENK